MDVFKETADQPTKPQEIPYELAAREQPQPGSFLELYCLPACLPLSASLPSQLSLPPPPFLLFVRHIIRHYRNIVIIISNVFVRCSFQFVSLAVF